MMFITYQSNMDITDTRQNILSLTLFLVISILAMHARELHQEPFPLEHDICSRRELLISVGVINTQTARILGKRILDC
jgi:hypothetical protein